MSFALIVPVKESLVELRSLLKKASTMLQPRIKMLIVMKRAGENGISKRALMEDVGASSQSIHNWRSAYKTGGIEALLQNGRKGKSGKPSVFTRQEHDRIANKLKDPKNGLAGFVELQQWIEQEFKKEVKYNTVLKYAVRHFGASVKVARKSHVNKDSNAVNTFKKTSRKR
jgi:transposase